MSTLRFARTLLVLGLAALPISRAYAGSDPESPTGSSQQKTTSELLTDLAGDNKANRVYAARALKMQLHRAQSVVEHGKEGSLARDEALANLDELEQRLPEQSRAALGSSNVVALAAEMLVMLGTPEALPELDAAIQKETRKAVLKRLLVAQAALTALGTNPAPPAPETPAAVTPSP